MHKNGELIQKLYEAFDKVDLETIQQAIADDAVAHLAGRGPISGTYKGKDEVLGLLGEFVSRTDGTFKALPHDILANDEHVVVLSKVTAKRGDKTLTEDGVEVFHVKDGKITEAFFTGMDTYDLDEFFS
jgi:uncharacterized protein